MSWNRGDGRVQGEKKVGEPPQSAYIPGMVAKREARPK